MTEPTTHLRRHRIPLIVLLAVPVLWWWPVFVGFLPDFMDTVTHTYPMRLAAARQVWEWTLPLWMPNQFSGMPLAANPQIAAWYPLQVLFYLYPSPLTHGLLAAFHYVLAGVGMYALVYWHAKSRTVALFAALLFQLSSMLVGRIALLPHVYTMAWVPWIFLLSEWAMRDRHRLPGLPAFALAWALALQILAGSPQVTYYTALALLVLWAVRWLLPLGDENGESLTQRLARFATHGAAAAALALLIAGVQLAPTLELTGQVERAALSVDRLSSGGLNGNQHWRALFGLTGQAHEDTDTINAIGVGAMLLALLAFVGPTHRRRALPYLAIGAGAYLLAMGPLAGVWKTVLPLYDHFHAPRRSLMFWTVAGCVLAGIGAGRLIPVLAGREAPVWTLPALLLLALASNFWVVLRVERIFTDPARHHAPEELLAELRTGGRFFTIDPSLSYSYDSRRADYGESLAPNLAAWHNVLDVQGYDPLVLERYALARDLASARSGVFYPSHGAFFTDPNSPVLRLLGVQYILGRWDLFDPGAVIPGTSIDADALAGRVELVHESRWWPLYRYTEERPMAWIVEQVTFANTPQEALRLSTVNDPYRTAFVEEPLDIPAITDPPGVSMEFTNARTIDVTMDEPSGQFLFLTVASAWAPGWTARTGGGQQAETLPSHGVLLGVAVPPGTESLRLRYAPLSFRLGAGLSAIGILLGTLMLRLRLEKEDRPGV